MRDAEGPLRVLVVGDDEAQARTLADGGEDGAAVEVLREDAVPARLAQPPAPDAVAILAGARDPVALAQLACSVDHEVAVLVLTRREEHREAAAALLFAPFIGPHVRCVVGDDAAGIRPAVLESARGSRRRRRHAADVVAATRRLSEAPAAPPLHAFASLATAFETTAIGVVVTDADGRVGRWTGPAARLLGRSPQGRVLADLLAEDARDAVRAALARASDSTPEPVLARLADVDRHVELSATAYAAPDGERGAVVLLVDATERVRLQAERRRVEREQRFLAEAGAVLDASLDLAETLERISELAVPDLGELCVLDSLDPRGGFRPPTIVAADPAVAAAVRETRRRWPLVETSAHPAARVVRTGRPQLLRALADRELALIAEDDAHLRSMQRIGYHTAIVVPLAARGRTHGALSVLRLTSPTPYEPADLALVETLASRAATALDNAWLYERERGIAATLQAALLPEVIPVFPGAQVAARYRPAADGLDVGGDWYDVLGVAPGRVGLVIGDVVGRGLRAAAVMGQLRNFLRAHALDCEDPAVVVQTVGRLMARLEVGDFATLLYAVVDVETGEGRFASAGHPPPVLVGADGRARLLEGPAQPPLAPGMRGERRSMGFRLDPGATLLLYTDGVVERRDEPIDVGLGRLLDAASRVSDDLDALCDDLLAMSAADATRDDRALVLLRRDAG